MGTTYCIMEKTRAEIFHVTVPLNTTYLALISHLFLDGMQVFFNPSP